MQTYIYFLKKNSQKHLLKNLNTLSLTIAINIDDKCARVTIIRTKAIVLRKVINNKNIGEKLCVNFMLAKDDESKILWNLLNHSCWYFTAVVILHQ